MAFEFLRRNTRIPISSASHPELSHELKYSTFNTAYPRLRGKRSVCYRPTQQHADHTKIRDRFSSSEPSLAGSRFQYIFDDERKDTSPIGSVTGHRSTQRQQRRNQHHHPSIEASSFTTSATIIMSNNKPSKKERCRILVLGSHKTRLERVFSILAEDEMHSQRMMDGVEIEFLAAAATFDSYKDERGNRVRYLLNIDYFPSHTDGTLEATPQSLLPFFDETRGVDDKEDAFGGIAMAVIGSGLNGDGDTEKIKTFLDTICTIKSVPVVAVQPNAEFASMADELHAFKLLSADGKAQAIRNRTMGPGKVAKFALESAYQLIADRQAARETAAREAAMLAVESERQQQEEEEEAPSAQFYFIDPGKKQYACRKCRSIMFGEDDFESPPHMPAQHNFGYRKTDAGSGSVCQSLFLHSVPPGMASDTSINEGKITCPKCDTKVGHWNWSGAQCSCGTWVCPAIQVPLSRVDEIVPHREDALPTGTVVSPLLANLLQSQQR